MIIFFIYAIILLILIYKNGCFGLFTDDRINNKTFTLLFAAKLLAIPVFYFLFVSTSPGEKKLDAAKFYSDAVVMNNLAYIRPMEYFKMLFGLQDDSQGSFFYNMCISASDNWDNGKLRDFFYNDNRIVIRLHSLIHFISFGSYFVHALINCFFSFIGLNFIYRTFKGYFTGLETILLTILCLFPSLWLYTGGLLKEGWVIFFLGANLITIKQVIEHGFSYKLTIILIMLIFFSLLLKPYILLYSLLFFALFFLVNRYSKWKYPILLFSLLLLISIVGMNCLSVMRNGKTFYAAALQRSREFSDLAKGGIFLMDEKKFVRLEYNYDLVKKVAGYTNIFTINKNVPYIYWENSHQQDTLFCKSNTDTLTHYKFVYDIPTAHSNIDVINGYSNPLILVVRSLYFTLGYPMFLNAKGYLQMLCSLENLLLLFSVLVVLIYLFFSKSNYFAIAMLMFALSVFILIGITTPNTGAIMRYRSPVAVFILMGALYHYRRNLTNSNQY